jgi:hypothetical protein
MMNQKGSIVVGFLPIFIGMVISIILLVDVGRIQYLKTKAQVLCDQVMLSILRVRAMSLERVATKWAPIGELISEGNSSGAFYGGDSWEDLIYEATQFNRSLSGYKGQITRIHRVVANANGFQKSDVKILEGDGLDLGLQTKSMWVTNQNMQQRLINHIWASRDWAISSGSPYFMEDAKIDANLPFSFLQFIGPGGPRKWNVVRSCEGHLIWDVDFSHSSVMANGNGGYPKLWRDVLVGSRVIPYRYPFYWVELTPYSGEGNLL